MAVINFDSKKDSHLQTGLFKKFWNLKRGKTLIWNSIKRIRKGNEEI